MAGFIRVPADDAGKRVDTVTLTDELVEVHRQKMVVTGGSGTAEVVVVTNAAPAGADMGLVVRQAGTLTAVVSGTVNVNGGVAISGTAIVAGSVAISGTATVAGNVNVSTMPAVTLAADQILGSISRTVQVAVGTPFTLNNISATVIVAGSIVVSGTATVAGNVNISTMPAVTLAADQILGSISRTVQVAVGTPFTLNNISASVQVATGAVADFNTSADTTQNLPLIGIAQSAAGGAVAWGGSVSVVNNVNISNTPSVVLAAGTANFGTLNDISRTVQVAIGTPFTVNNISATVIVSGNVSISTTVQVAIATPFTVNDISRTVQVAVATPFTLQGISTTVTVAGNVNISATAPVGIAYVTEKTTGSLVPVGDSANAAIRVNVVAGAAGGVSQVDGTTFSTQAANFVPMGGIFDDAASDTLSENDAGVVRLTTNRGMHVNLRTDGGVKLEDSANSALRVNIVAGGGSGGTSQTDGTTFSTQAALFTPIGGIFDDVASDPLSENDAGVVRMTTNRAFHVNIRDATGAELGAASATGIFIRTATVALPANIGVVNNISATVIVAGNVNISATPSVILAAGTANFGTLNDISKTVQVAVGTPFIIQGISTTVIIAMSNQTLQGISTTVTVTGVVNVSNTPSVILAAGTAVFGTLNNISRTVAASCVLYTTGGTAVEDATNNALRVNVVAGSAGGPSVTDNTTFSVSATGTPASLVPIGGLFLDTAPGVSAGAAGIQRITSARAAHVNIRDAAGNELGAASASGIFVRTATIALAADQILGSISRTVQVAVGTPFVIQGISTTVLVAMSNQTLQGISTTVTIVGVVSLAAGSILDSISATVGVKGQVSLAASTNNIGFINNISATVAVGGEVSAGASLSNINKPVLMGGNDSVGGGVARTLLLDTSGRVILGASTQNIGFINNISATVIVAMSNQTLQGISTTVTVTGVVNISNTPSVILAAGTANFGTLNDISRTVQVAIATPIGIASISATVTVVTKGFTPAVMAASHGPKCVTASTSSNVTLIASPGAGANIYVTQLMVGNFSSTLTKARIGTSASIATVVQPLAASGGGFVFNFDPPWMLSASEACLCSVKPNVADAFFTVNFFVI